MRNPGTEVTLYWPCGQILRSVCLAAWKSTNHIYMGWGQVCFVYLLVWTDHVCGQWLLYEQHILNSQQFGSHSRVCMEGEAREAPI